MQPLFVHLNHCKKILGFFCLPYKKEKMLRPSTKAKFKKPSNYLNTALRTTPFSSYVDIESTDTFFLI